MESRCEGGFPKWGDRCAHSRLASSVIAWPFGSARCIFHWTLRGTNVMWVQSFFIQIQMVSHSASTFCHYALETTISSISRKCRLEVRVQMNFISKWVHYIQDMPQSSLLEASQGQELKKKKKKVWNTTWKSCKWHQLRRSPLRVSIDASNWNLQSWNTQYGVSDT